MEDVHRLLELGDIHHPVGSTRFPDSDFPCTWADVVEGLPVIGLQCRLHFAELEASLAARIVGECQQVVVGGAHPSNLFFVVHRISRV